MDDQTPVSATAPVNPPSLPADGATPAADPGLADSTVAATLTTAAAQTPDPLAIASRRGKELQPAVVTEAATTLASPQETLTATPEAQISAGPAEVEPVKEMEPEVEKAIESITDQKMNGPKNVVVASEQMPTELPKTVAQPVIVLPLTEEKMSHARRKGVNTSVRWLYEWCARQIHKIKDVLVVYRE